jgi:uncharacterized membrane protein
MPDPHPSSPRAPQALTWVLGAAVLTSGLLAGFFYTYACSVMPGLARADDRTLIDAMQQINEVVLNPVFFLTFYGAPVLMIVALVMQRRSGSRDVLWWIVAGLVLYGICLMVTGALNVPLNDDLDQAGDPSQIADPGAVRDDFYGPWVAWNIVRTLTMTASFACLGWALFLRGRESKSTAVAARAPNAS